MEVCCSVLLAKPGGLSRILKGAVWVEKDCSKSAVEMCGALFLFGGREKGRATGGKVHGVGVGAGVSWRQFLLEPEPV